MTSPWSRLFAHGAESPPLAVVVYSRAGRGCRDKAKAVLERFGAKCRIEIEEVDVDADPELRERHGREVPVVAVAGKVRFRGLVAPVLLERLLKAAAPGR